MQVDVYTKSGETAGQIDLEESVFGIEPNENAMHRAVVAHLTNRRQGTRKTKARREVRGGGRKPWRQKGRGTARAGTIRSPLWKGGGTIFGPQPYIYESKLPKRVKKLAKKSAFSLRTSEQNLMIVEDFTFDEIKTKQMAEVLENLELQNEKTLVLLPQADKNVYMSARNIPGISIQPADKISVYDILNHKKIVLFKGAVDTIVENFNK